MHGHERRFWGRQVSSLTSALMSPSSVTSSSSSASSEMVFSTTGALSSIAEAPPQPVGLATSSPVRNDCETVKSSASLEISPAPGGKVVSSRRDSDEQENPILMTQKRQIETLEIPTGLKTIEKVTAVTRSMGVSVPDKIVNQKQAKVSKTRKVVRRRVGSKTARSDNTGVSMPHVQPRNNNSSSSTHSALRPLSAPLREAPTRRVPPKRKLKPSEVQLNECFVFACNSKRRTH